MILLLFLSGEVIAVFTASIISILDLLVFASSQWVRNKAEKVVTALFFCPALTVNVAASDEKSVLLFCFATKAPDGALLIRRSGGNGEVNVSAWLRPPAALRVATRPQRCRAGVAPLDMQQLLRVKVAAADILAYKERNPRRAAWSKQVKRQYCGELSLYQVTLTPPTGRRRPRRLPSALRSRGGGCTVSLSAPSRELTQHHH